MDYGKEVENLNKGTDAWKPELGVHQVVVLAEPTETEYVDDETDRVTPQIKLHIETAGKQTEWFVSKGKTTQSLYGQLMVLGKHHSGLAGVKFSLVVNEVKEGKKKRKSYTITEAIQIMQKQQERQPAPPQPQPVTQQPDVETVVDHPAPTGAS